jgi:hypothetical protein
MVGFAWSILVVQAAWAAMIALLLLSVRCSGDSCSAPAGWFIATVGLGQIALLPFSTVGVLYLFGRWLARDEGY